MARCVRRGYKCVKWAKLVQWITCLKSMTSLCECLKTLKHHYHSWAENTLAYRFILVVPQPQKWLPTDLKIECDPFRMLLGASKQDSQSKAGCFSIGCNTAFLFFPLAVVIMKSKCKCHGTCRKVIFYLMSSVFLSLLDLLTTKSGTLNCSNAFSICEARCKSSDNSWK